MLRAGSILAGRFHLAEQIGEGGMAIVWRASDDVLGADVAVKLLRPSLARDPTARARFRAEAMNTRRARNDHVVEIHELVADAEPPFFVMPLLSGCSLSERIRQTGGLDFAEAETILVQLLRGLAVAHGQRIVHRDVKPHNVFLHRPPGSDALRVVLLDFGIAYDDRRQAALTHAGMVVGTPAYMAPEVMAGEAGGDAPTADVYAAGLIAYEMVTGALPRATTTKPPPLHETRRGIEAGVSAAFGRAVDRALALDPALRPQSAGDFLAAIDSPGGLFPGDVVDGRYRITEVLGEGGMATIHRAVDLRLGGEIALKVLAELGPCDDDEDLRGRFRDECEILMRMDHPHVVGVRAVGSHRNQPYCALELIEGRPLGAAAAGLGWAGVTRAIEHVAVALDDVHAAGVIHRDVKADNIMIRPNGDAVLIDFGVARLGRAWRTRTGVIIGTPGAEAPEQVEGGHMSGSTDQWALAAVCYGLLSGAAPGEAIDIVDPQERALQTMENVALGRIRPLEQLRADLPREVCAAVMRGLALEPADRFRSASAFAAAVKRTSARARLPGEVELTNERERRLWFVGAIAAAAFAALVTTAIVWANGTPPSESPTPAALVDDAPDEVSEPAMAVPAPNVPAAEAPKTARRSKNKRGEPAPMPAAKAPISAAKAPNSAAKAGHGGLMVDPTTMMKEVERMADDFERATLEKDPAADFDLPDPPEDDWAMQPDEGD